MASNLVDPAGCAPAAWTMIRAYLAELGGRLVTSARQRRKIMAEIKDGLLESVIANIALGMEPVHASTRAIHEFGTPAVVAREFARGFAEARIRRTALTLLQTGPVIGALWLGAIAANHLAPPTLAGPWLALPVVGFGLAVCVPAAVVTLAATGRRSRRLPGLRAVAPTAAATSAIAAVAVDLIILGMAASVAMTSPGTRAWELIVAASGASVTRLVLSGRAARKCLAARTEFD